MVNWWSRHLYKHLWKGQDWLLPHSRRSILLARRLAGKVFTLGWMVRLTINFFHPPHSNSSGYFLRSLLPMFAWHSDLCSSCFCNYNLCHCQHTCCFENSSPLWLMWWHKKTNLTPKQQGKLMDLCSTTMLATTCAQGICHFQNDEREKIIFTPTFEVI